MRGVPAIDIERGVGLRVTELLGLGEDRREIQTLTRHAREDVVARAVENSMDRLEAVSDESLAHRFDNRNSSGNGGFIKNRHALLAGEFENLATMLGEQGLVTGHDDLSSGDGFFDKRQRDIDAAHQLHDDLDRRISEDFVRIGGEKRSRSLDITGLGEIANGDFFDLEGRADALLEEGGVALKIFVNPRAHGAEACESDADWFAHLKGRGLSASGCFPVKTEQGVENIRLAFAGITAFQRTGQPPPKKNCPSRAVSEQFPFPKFRVDDRHRPI